MKYFLTKHCEDCLYRRQERLSSDPEFLAEIRSILDQRSPEDTAPYLVYLFNQVYKKKYGHTSHHYEMEKIRFNDLVLSMEESIRQKYEEISGDSNNIFHGDILAASIAYARIGNYIDFGPRQNVSPEDFLDLFGSPQWNDADQKNYASFCRQAATARSFLLLADNCGEIVLDKIFLELLHERFPQLDLYVMVRGGNVLNDATMEDALYVGLDRIAKVIHNGRPVSGTIYSLLSEEAKEIFDHADLILAKGQGNYESLYLMGRHIFYSFLCKCDFFVERFGVPELTGMFLEENSPS